MSTTGTSASGLPIAKNHLWEGTVQARSLQGLPFVHTPAEGEKPAHWHVRHEGTDIHLRDGLTPAQLATARAEIKVRQVRNHRGTAQYVYCNLYPAPAGSGPTKRLYVGRGRSVDECFEGSHGGRFHLSPIG